MIKSDLSFGSPTPDLTIAMVLWLSSGVFVPGDGKSYNIFTIMNYERTYMSLTIQNGQLTFRSRAIMRSISLGSATIGNIKYFIDKLRAGSME